MSAAAPDIDAPTLRACDLHFNVGRRAEAEALVMAYHYSRRVPSNVQMVGSLHRDGGLFGGDGAMVAAAFFSIPPIQWKEPVLELSRLVRGQERVPLSMLLSRCAKELRRRGHDLLVSFADKTQGHEGYVYRASNWQYAGYRKPRIDGVLWNGEFINQRQCQHLWGTSLSSVGVIDRARPGIVGAIEPHYDMGKHCYWLPITKEGQRRADRLGLESQSWVSR